MVRNVFCLSEEKMVAKDKVKRGRKHAIKKKMANHYFMNFSTSV